MSLNFFFFTIFLAINIINIDANVIKPSSGLNKADLAEAAKTLLEENRAANDVVSEINRKLNEATAASIKKDRNYLKVQKAMLTALFSHPHSPLPPGCNETLTPDSVSKIRNDYEDQILQILNQYLTQNPNDAGITLENMFKEKKMITNNLEGKLNSEIETCLANEENCKINNEYKKKMDKIVEIINLMRQFTDYAIQKNHFESYVKELIKKELSNERIEKCLEFGGDYTLKDLLS